MELDDAIRYAMDGKAVLFLGSGFSIGGITKNNEKLETGVGLSHYICKKLGIGVSDNLTISADRYLHDDTCKRSLSDFMGKRNFE